MSALSPIEPFEEFAARLGGKLNQAIIKRALRTQFPGDPRQAADGFAASLGYRALGEQWSACDGDGVKNLSRFLEKTMAYNVSQLAPDEAVAAANQFFSYFAVEPVTRLSNVTSIGANTFSWDPITTSTFDAAFIAIDADHIGLIMFEDED